MLFLSGGAGAPGSCEDEAKLRQYVRRRGGGGVCARGGARASTVGGDRWRGRRARYLVIGCRRAPVTEDGGRGVGRPRCVSDTDFGWVQPCVWLCPIYSN